MSHVSNTVTLKAMYFAYFHSIMKYGIIFWGNSSSSKNIFTLQKKVIRIIAGVKPRHSCGNLFKRLEILPLPCEYIFSLMNFIVNNQELVQTNSAVHSVNTRSKHCQSHAFRKVHSILASIFSTVCHLVSQAW
jgi:hypothetical protein